ncbi:probable RWD domain-containing protein 2B [Coccomyxa sp. Obi]|nr:probable RWD domain-containing protein 2B [Coccomyxa sp. Obi]
MAAPYSDTLQRQVTEIEALWSVFPEEGCLLFSHVEEENLAAATRVLASGGTYAPRQLSGTVRLPGLSISGQPVSLRFVLPALYPRIPPLLQIECSASRGAHDALTHEFHQCAEEQAGAEVLLLAVDCLQQAVQRLNEQQGCSSSTAGGDAEAHSRSQHGDRQDSGASASYIARRLIWFHHILSTTKRKAIVNWGNELELGGYCIPGHPGVLICEAQARRTMLQSM